MSSAGWTKVPILLRLAQPGHATAATRGVAEELIDRLAHESINAFCKDTRLEIESVCRVAAGNTGWIRPLQMSRFVTESAFFSMNSRRGST